MGLIERDMLVNDLLDRLEGLEGQVRELSEYAIVAPAAGTVPEQFDWSTISGWVITGTVLRDVDGKIVLDASVPSITIAAGGYIESSDFVAGTSGFQINGGTAEFNDVVIRGTIYAEVGEIGGWTISSTALSGGNATLHSSGYLLLGTGNDVARVDAQDATYRLWAGNAAAGSAPFRVSKAGELWATNAHVTGEIDANSGHLGSLDVDGVITVGATTPYIQIDGPNKRIQSSNFAAGLAGFRIQEDGDAEFNNVTVRGAVQSTVFVKDLVEAWAGSLVVVKSAGVLTSDMAVPGSGTWAMTLDDPPAGGFLFANGDICRCKSEYSGGVAEVWFTVSGRTDNGDGTQNYTCTYQNGTRSITYPAGGPVLDYGVSGGGGLTLTADLSGAPYLSIFTHAGSPWTTTTTRARLGNLNGAYGISSDYYGIGVGDYSGGNYMRYEATGGFTIVSGDGAIEIDANGIILDALQGKYSAGAVEWKDGATRHLSIGTDVDLGAVVGTYVEGKKALTLSTTDSGEDINLSPAGTGSVVVTKDLLSSQDVRIGAGLFVGGVATDPAAGEIWIPDAAGTTHVLEPDTDGSTPGLVVRCLVSPAVGEPIFAVQSPGQADRLIVTHASHTYVGDDLRVNMGLYVGQNADPDPDDIHFDGNLKSVKSATTYDVYAFHPLTTPVVAWSPTAISTVGTSTQIDMSSFAGLSFAADVKAWLLEVEIYDSGTWGAGAYWFRCGPTSTYWYAHGAYCYGGSLAAKQIGACPCDGNGDIWYQAGASGASTLTVTIRVWGYWI